MSSTPQPEPVDTRSTVDTRALLLRALGRIRRDLVTVQALAEITGINEPVPAKVTRALSTLDAWTRQLARSSRPGPGRHRPKA